MTKKGYLL
jgi:hypothetical protein